MRPLLIYLIVSILQTTYQLSLDPGAEGSQGNIKCHLYNSSACINYGQCSGFEFCKVCYLLYNITSRAPVLRGCWQSNNGSCRTKLCIAEESPTRNSSFGFCCCSDDLCNWNFTINTSASTTPSPKSSTGMLYNDSSINLISTQDPSVPPDSVNTHVYVFVVSCLLFILLSSLAAFWYLRKRNQPQFSGVPTSDDTLPETETVPPLSIGPVHSLEEKAKGKFGSVYKGQLGHDEPVQYVAVKVFPVQDHESWRHECEIYRLPQMKHENILNFLGSEQKDYPVQSYWLITEYHELGSLYDYLKAHVVSYEELLKIGHGIARGLALLHDELLPRGNQGMKPTVAHRDFKSKNVILKPDLTPCIADFGLARIFSPSEIHIEALGQVGTRKYMAPEVLDGAISFTKDSLLRIDMYACGLVLWELASRCSAQLEPVAPHKLPFDDEVGPNPSIEDMAGVVVDRKLRPALPMKFSPDYEEAWSVIRLTIEELWDQDAEARLSACCVEERLASLIKKLNTTNNGQQ